MIVVQAVSRPLTKRVLTTTVKKEILATKSKLYDAYVLF
jgi:hypothetical protein